MAVTKTHPIKSTLKAAIDYILNPEKTDGKLLASSFGCGLETADIEFAWTREAAGDRGTHLGRHLIQSFAVGETTPEEAHKIGMELAGAVLGGKYEFVLTTHVDKDHLHNHLIFNAVSFVDYKKYHSNKQSYHFIRRTSDRICKEHVLGRSVDTYSDEVDETQANQMIEAAIDQYYIQQDKNGMLLFMEVMVTRMQQAGEVIVPYITENPFMSEEQISKVKAGDTISLDHDVRLKIETVKDADEKEWIGVFTSSEEMHKGSAGNVQMNQSIESILRLALNWEQVNGIVINPFGKYIQMTKKMIELLINGYEYNENERKSKDDENN